MTELVGKCILANLTSLPRISLSRMKKLRK
jgi:hypothetical protein